MAYLSHLCWFFNVLKGTWHSLEPHRSAVAKDVNNVCSATDEGEGVDFVRIALGSTPAILTKRWVRAATYACGGVKFHRSFDPPSATAVATHGLRVNVVASTMPPIEPSVLSAEAGLDEAPQPFLTETVETGQAHSGGGDATSLRRNGTIHCTTNLEDGDNGCTFDARFNVQGQLPILNDTGPILVFVDGVRVGELTAGKRFFCALCWVAGLADSIRYFPCSRRLLNCVFCRESPTRRAAHFQWSGYCSC